ncbi:MAG: response regulator, partial [bacterium]
MPDAEQNPISILLIDDNPTNLAILAQRLGKEGFHTDCVESGRAGIELLGQMPYDLVILDVMMPEMSGL